MNYRDIMIHIIKKPNSKFHLCTLGLINGIRPIKDKSFKNEFDTQADAIEKIMELKAITDLKIKQ